jgi:hypothetical protein
MAMAERSEFVKSLPPLKQWVIAGLILLFLAIVCTPISLGNRQSPHSKAMQAERLIGLAMTEYSEQHNGTYPTGKSSTEIFQKLIDGGEITDPAVFWLNFPGKTKATSNTLKPENVCFDVTIPIQTNSSDFLPVVFSTGYRIQYIPGAKAVPLFPHVHGWFDGIAVYYHGNNAIFIKSGEQPDGTIPNIISPNFDPAGQHYQQLTPTGPLLRPSP